MNQPKRIKLSDLNQSLVCILCGGYFIDATTIIECLHSFCKSCIVRYLESNKYCPICDVQVHETKPLQNIRSDQTLQNIVYKLVPGLFRKEYQTRAQFYSHHPELKPALLDQSDDNYIYLPDDKISLSLEYKDISKNNHSSHKRRYLECPGAVTISHLHKLVKAKYNLNSSNKIEMFYNTDYLDPTLTLIDVAYIYSWRRKHPINLSYTIFETFSTKGTISSEDLNIDEKSKHSPSIEQKSEKKNNLKWSEVQIQISESGVMSFTNIDGSEKNNNNTINIKETNETIISKGSCEKTKKENEISPLTESQSSTPIKLPQKIEVLPVKAPPKMAVVAPTQQQNKRQSYKTLKSPPKNWNPSISRIPPQNLPSTSKPNKFFKGRNQSRLTENASISTSSTSSTTTTTSAVRPIYPGKAPLLRIDPRTLTPIPSTITSTIPQKKNEQVNLEKNSNLSPNPMPPPPPPPTPSNNSKSIKHTNTEEKSKKSNKPETQNNPSNSSSSSSLELNKSQNVTKATSTFENFDNNFCKKSNNNSKINVPINKKLESKPNNNIEKIAQSLTENLKQNQEKKNIKNPQNEKTNFNVPLSPNPNMDSKIYKQNLKNQLSNKKIPDKHVSNSYSNSLAIAPATSSPGPSKNDVLSISHCSKNPTDIHFVKNMPLVPVSHKPLISLGGSNDTSLLPHVGIHRMANPVVPASPSFLTANKISTNGLSRLLSPFLHGGLIYPTIPQFTPRIPNTFHAMTPSSIDLLFRYQGLESHALEDPGVDLSRKTDKDKVNTRSTK